MRVRHPGRGAIALLTSATRENACGKVAEVAAGGSSFSESKPTPHHRDVGLLFVAGILYFDGSIVAWSSPPSLP